MLVAAGTLTSLTAVLLAVHTRLGLPSILLLYLSAIVAIALIGGTWPALTSAVAASLLDQLVLHAADAHVDDRRPGERVSASWCSSSSRGS